MMLRLQWLALMATVSVCGCYEHQATDAGVVPETVGPDSIRAAAVKSSLHDFFSGKWTYGTIYIEANEFLPADMSNVGKYDAEIVERAELAARFRESTTAPALATVKVYTVDGDPPECFRVVVSYTGLQTETATAIPLGGERAYKYRMENGQAVLLEQTHVEY
jgi:hypothetical protein